MKAIVTGVAGFIASHVADRLINDGYKVVGVDNLSTGKIENVNPKVELIQGDITDPKLYDQLPQVDYVFHLAALARIQPSIQDPVTSNATNLDGTLLLLEYCRRNNAKIIFSGSSSIYAGDKLPIQEDDNKHPKSPYGLQKYMAEQYIELYSELFGLDYVILRYFNVYGPRQILDGAYAAVVGIFLQQYRDGDTITITGDGENRRDFTFVGDVSKANVLAANWPKGVYNIGSGRNYSINEIASFVDKDKTGNIVHIDARPGEARATLADNSRAREQGWEPTMDIKEWISKA